jgi:3-deoxy-7-phosphoheptulonate synthase / chorismate mutase
MNALSNQDIDVLREKIDNVNLHLLKLINERGQLVKEIGNVKKSLGLEMYDPVRERDMLNLIANNNEGPFETAKMQHMFKEIFKAGIELIEDDHRKALLVSRKKKPENTEVHINGEVIGRDKKTIIAGPCAVESFEQVEAVAIAMKKQGLSIMRGGAFKPRTSPYDFQGLGFEGLKILRAVADKHDMRVVTEIINPAHVEEALNYIDVIQIGARNMQNFELLKEVGGQDKPVLLKRGISATIQEFIYAAEYVMSRGNGNIVLCERGIRTYEKATRNTLDITAVPILKKETHLPVLVDVTHSTGRRDLLLPAAKAALAIEADGIMLEVHPDPAVALSDSMQQLDIPDFEQFMSKLRSSRLLEA